MELEQLLATAHDELLAAAEIEAAELEAAQGKLTALQVGRAAAGGLGGLTAAGVGVCWMRVGMRSSQPVGGCQCQRTVALCSALNRPPFLIAAPAGAVRCTGAAARHGAGGGGGARVAGKEGRHWCISHVPVWQL